MFRVQAADPGRLKNLRSKKCYGLVEWSESFIHQREERGGPVEDWDLILV